MTKGRHVNDKEAADETFVTKGSRKGAPSENTDGMKARLRSSKKVRGKSGNGRHKVGDGNNPFASALKKVSR